MDLGRWLNRDPINETGSKLLTRAGGAFNRVEEKNPYAFVGDNPINRSDSLGLTGFPYPGDPPPPQEPRPCAKFEEWYQKEKQDMSWLNGLPACPCRLTCVKPWFSWNALNPDSSVWHDPSTWTFGYHPGADWCIRSKAKGGSKAGQQCCYDWNGKLITNGPGTGTPDKVSPDAKNFGSGGHQEADVEPYDLAIQCDGGSPGAAAAKYREVRPPDNSKGCGKNP